MFTTESGTINCRQSLTYRLALKEGSQQGTKRCIISIAKCPQRNSANSRVGGSRKSFEQTGIDYMASEFH